MAGKKEAEKKQEEQQEQLRRIRTPRRDELEMFGLVVQLHGTNQIKVACEDGKERMIRIPGKMRKRVWIRQGDVVIVKLWDFQPIKGDVVWRYLGFQTEHLRRKGLLDKLPL
ncbi:MAG: translation initiation factor eIF-1A [Candidatus Diapherotrites archaeon]|nr:translation initiation factor eIF-1A [Candidatus Micrarchaeota archaeon]MBU1939170.1 translation initiation factor eIF-1A [Candidatus Micrarchaeota archaeon]